MKKIALFLGLIFLFSAVGVVSAAETVPFTDSLGRTVEVPKEIAKVAVTGQMAQITVFALCPDTLVGIADPWDASAKQYLDPKYLELPVLGQLYGGKGRMNPESLLVSGAEIVIDVGEVKGNTSEDLDALSEQTGIPFVHIDAALETSGEAYRKLGELLGMPEEAEKLASYCERAYKKAAAFMEKTEKARVLCVNGQDGLNVIAKGSYHAELIDLLAENVAVVNDPSDKGTGNAVDFEQLLIWDPDVILFAPNSIYKSVGDDPLWQSLSAIADGTYYEVPSGPYNWLGFPPAVQRLLGMQWLAKLLYPESAGELDLCAAVKEYYSLFYHYALTDGQVDALLAHSVAKR